MPGGDRTGPSGQGPLTGRKMGLCTGNDSPGFQQPVYGYGRGRGGMGYGSGRGGMGYGRGRGGMGYGRGYLPGPVPVGMAPIYPSVPKEQQIENLNRSKEYLQGQLENLSKEIDRLSKSE